MCCMLLIVRTNENSHVFTYITSQRKIKVPNNKIRLVLAEPLDKTSIFLHLNKFILYV